MKTEKKIKKSFKKCNPSNLVENTLLLNFWFFLSDGLPHCTTWPSYARSFTYFTSHTHTFTIPCTYIQTLQRPIKDMFCMAMWRLLNKTLTEFKLEPVEKWFPRKLPNNNVGDWRCPSTYFSVGFLIGHSPSRFSNNIFVRLHFV